MRRRGDWRSFEPSVRNFVVVYAEREADAIICKDDGVKLIRILVANGDHWRLIRFFIFNAILNQIVNNP